MFLGKNLTKFLSKAKVAILSSSSVQGDIVKSYFESFCVPFVFSDVFSFMKDAFRYKFDVVLCDRNLPDGLKAEFVVDELRKRKELGNPVVVVITSEDEFEWKSDNPPDFVLPKPFDKELVLNLVVQFICERIKLNTVRNKILIVDDSPLSRKRLISLFSGMFEGEFVEAASGREALEKMRELEGELKLVTMDLHMPDLNGLEVTRIARSEGIFAPIFMITSEIDFQFVEEAFKSGVNFYISKKDLNEEKLSLLNELVEFVRTGKLYEPVLLVEDSSFMRNLLAAQLYIHGHLVVPVDSVAKALRVFKLNPVSISVVNLNLEEESGIDFIKAAKRLKSKEYERLTMVYTSSSDPLVIFDAFHQGAHDFIKAPFNLCDFYIKVKSLFRLRSILRELESSKLEFYRLSVRDELTGVFNRRYFNEYLLKAIKSAVMGGQDLAVIIIDVDRFKQINDSCGHDVGDEVLKQLAKILEESVRTEDVVARLGGDEFAVLLPSADMGSCAKIVERIRNKLSSVKLPRCPDVPLGISAGCASLKEIGDVKDVAEASKLLLKLADKRMYENKSANRLKG